MENTEFTTATNEVNPTPESQLRVTPLIKKTLLSSTKWMKFLSIVFCILMVLVLLMGIFFLHLGSMPIAETDAYQFSSTLFLCFGVLYVILSIVYIYPIVNAFRLISHTRKALNADSTADFEASAADLHSILWFLGVMTFLSAIFSIIGFSISIAGGFTSFLS
jgi:uncharacterized membrane protein YphA (DoxX/SURF4 family)